MTRISKDIEYLLSAIVGQRGRKKVDFVIAGTQKGGTTALDSYLRSHSGICMSGRKEVHFFDNDKLFSGWRTFFKYRYYHSYFTQCNETALRGETTPEYMFWIPAPQRIAEYNPNIKIIVLLRNPVYRAYSSWNMARRRYGHASMLDELNADSADKTRILEHYVSQVTRGPQKFGGCRVARSMYSYQIERIWSVIPKRNTLFLKTERMKNEPRQVLTEVCEFLGVDPAVDWNVTNNNFGVYKEKLPNDVKDILCTYLLEDVRRVESLLGWDCSDWITDCLE